jgi:hypothetical protein
MPALPQSTLSTKTFTTFVQLLTKILTYNTYVLMCCWTIQNYVAEATVAFKKTPDDDRKIETRVGV